MTQRVNNPESCICCSRRADGLAVGRPGKLGWFCTECGPDLARTALTMSQRDFDTLERMVAEKVAKDAANSDITLTPDELPEFVQWCVGHFAETMRKHVEQGGAPF